MDGKQYAIPQSYEAGSLLWYNKTLLDSLKLPIPKTVEEFERACDTAIKNGLMAVAFGGGLTKGTNMWLLANYMNSVAGADNVVKALQGSIKLTDAPFRQAFEQFNKHWQAGYYADKRSHALVTADVQPLWFQQKALFIPQGSWFAMRAIPQNLPFEWGCALYPALKPNGPQTLAKGIGANFMINKASMFRYALTDWDGMGRPVFTGLANVRRMLADDVFHRALFNNSRYTLIFLLVPTTFALLASLGLRRTGRGRLFFRTVWFLPFVVSALVASGIWRSLYNPYFRINAVLRSLGLVELAKISLLGDMTLAFYAVIFVDFWHWWPFPMVLFMAALQQVDPNLYEVAGIEGANPWQTFWFVTIPQILPTVAFICLVTIIRCFLSWDYVYVMTEGGPAQTTEVASSWVYKQAFLRYRAGYATSMSLTVCLLLAGVYYAFNRLQKRGWGI